MTAVDPIPYSDAKIRRILSTVRTIAMVGASSNWNRPSYFVMKYLQGKGYRVIPVNPGTAGQEQLGEQIYASLRDIPDKIDMVDVFRASDQVGPIVDDAIAIGAKVVWMQLGVRNDEAAAQRRGGRHRSDHEPLPEDRVRPSGRRAVMERRQFRHHPQPRGPSRPPNARQAARHCRRPMSAMGSRRAPSTPAPRPIRPPVRAPRRSSRPRLMFSMTSITPRRSSTCTISATSTRG